MSPSSSERTSSTRILVIALVAAAVLLVPAGLVRASGGNGSLRGYITDASTAAGIAGATVQVTTSDTNWVFQATTDANGYYALTLPNHQYTVQVSAPAYTVNTTSADVGSGQTVWNNMSLDAAPSRTAVIQGYVTDGVTSAAVTAGEIVASTVWWSSTDYANASALNATGFYQIDVVPGTYTLSTSGIQGYASYTYGYLYPNAGTATWWNISLSPSPLVAWINGTVEDASTYAPIPSATVTASVGSLLLPSVQSNATGAFSLHVPMGTIAITADAAGHAPDSTTDYIYSAGAYSLTLYLTPLSASERGWVRDGLTGAPIAGALFAASPFWSTGYFDQATTNASGYFALNLTADDFDLAASATGYTSWAGYAFLSAGQVVWTNVTLWPIIAPVQGYVVDGGTGAHLPNVYVYAYDSRSGYSAYAVSDSTGFFSFILPPSPAMTLRVNGVAPYAGAVAFPDVHAYVTNWVNLTLPRLDAALDVSVSDGLTGLPIAGAYVYAYWSTGSDYGTADANGVATVPVPSGLPLTVTGYATGYLSYYGSLDPVTGTHALAIVLNPDLPQNVTVQGYVYDASTLSPIASAYVEATGYNGSNPWDYTSGTGFYTLSIVPEPQTITVTDWQYEEGLAAVSPVGGSTIWVNFTIAPDTTSPGITNFTATPQNDVGPANPTTLHAVVNESLLSSASMTLFKLQSAASGVGTFVQVGSIPAQDVYLNPASPGNTTVSTAYATRTPLTTLTDGTSSTWWPQGSYYYPYQDIVSGTFLNATLGAPVYATAVFDTQTGSLLYVVANGAYIDPTDQPTATFTPQVLGYRLNLTTGTFVGYAYVTGPTFQIGSLSVSQSSVLSTGEYAALLTVYDTGSNYAQAWTFFNVTSDTVPPVARAGPNQTVNQGATVTLNGTGSTDNVGITSYTWTFTDGTAVVLHGAVVTHVFPNAGVYHVTLTVSDAAGNTATSSLTVTVRDTTPPSVSIAAPAAGATVSNSITVTVSAFDNVGVVRVEIRVDGVVLANDTSAPYTLTFNTTSLSNGNHTLEAVAFDAAGNSATTTETLRVSNVQAAAGLLGLDTSLWIILLIVILGVGVLVIVLVALRRKPRAPMAAPPAPPVPPPPPAEPPQTGPGSPGP